MARILVRMAWVVTLCYIPAIFIFHGIPSFMRSFPFIVLLLLIAAATALLTSRAETHLEQRNKEFESKIYPVPSAHVFALLDQKKMINAIALYKKETRLGLAEAKWAVEQASAARSVKGLRERNKSDQMGDRT